MDTQSMGSRPGSALVRHLLSMAPVPPGMRCPDELTMASKASMPGCCPAPRA